MRLRRNRATAPISDADQAAIKTAQFNIALSLPIGAGSLLALLNTPAHRLAGQGIVYTVPLIGAVVLGLAGGRVARAMRQRGRVAHGLLQGLGAALLIAAGMGFAVAQSSPRTAPTPGLVAVLLIPLAFAALAGAYSILVGGPRVWQPAPRFSAQSPVHAIVRSGLGAGAVLCLLSLCCAGIAIPTHM